MFLNLSQQLGCLERFEIENIIFETNCEIALQRIQNLFSIKKSLDDMSAREYRNLIEGLSDQEILLFLETGGRFVIFSIDNSVSFQQEVVLLGEDFIGYNIEEDFEEILETIKKIAQEHADI
jgi:hypothetical protein